MKNKLAGRLRDQNGATVILVALAMIVLLGMAALAIDVGYLYVVRGELQNAADAGALAGTQVLYNSNGTQVNTGANQVALDYVHAHHSERADVDVLRVERGHWSFATRTFTPNASLTPVNLWDVTTAELDANTNFINAVRVVTIRKTIPDATGLAKPERPFFARIFGADGPVITATAVGYIGFAGTLPPEMADQPVAICKQAILDASGNYTCGVGRMINSGSNTGHQTGGWTNFTQSPCDTASANSVRPLVCTTAGNPRAVFLGQGMGTTGGMLETAYDSMERCWRQNSSLDANGDGIPDRPWRLTLPVIDCPGNNTGNCATVVGAVTIDVIWMTKTDKNQMIEVPRVMGGWTCPVGATGLQCWDSFVTAFALKDVLNATSATYEDKTLYFLPDCTPHETLGTTGGQNFGMLARIPVLVK